MVVLSSFPRPTEGIRLEHQNTRAFLENVDLGKGTLYIAESKLSWIRGDEYGFSIDYPHISLHAISRDATAFPFDCLFLMLDIKLEVSQTEMDYNPEEEQITELRFVPEDRGMLDAMFHALSACQALHPDPEDSCDEDFYEDYSDDYAEDGISSQMDNLCITGNSVYGAVDSTVAENMVVAAEGRTSQAVGMAGMVGTEVDTAVVVTSRSSSSHRSPPFCCHTEKHDNLTDTGCFDDAEN